MVSVFLVGSSFSMKKNDPKPVYAFGLSASFMDKDSVVYFTSIQLLDSVHLEDGFLPLRARYSSQLKNYVEENRLQQYSTSMIYFSENKKKLEKNRADLYARYQKIPGILAKELSPEQFRFVKPREE